MKKAVYIIAAAGIAALLQFYAATGAYAGWISPELEGLKAGEQASVIVELKSQVDPKAVTKGVKGRNKGLRTGLLVKALKDNAELTQKEVMKLINSYRAAGKAGGVKPLWIVNAVALTAPRELIDQLAGLPEVLEILPDRPIPLVTPVLAAGPAETNLGVINAPVMWDMGYTGQGVVVANVDTGVDWDHPDLASSYRGGTDSWYDAHGVHATPYDYQGHGTGTMGVMVGGSASGKAIGVAPGAKWIAAKMFSDSDHADTSDAHLCYQWILDPDGNPATDDAPDIVNNSWGITGCFKDLEPDIAAMRAAGILPVYSAGNEGPNDSTDASPANNAGALSVGATDIYDNPAVYSSRGPNSCSDPLSPEIFPKMCAPGSAIKTSTLSYGGLANYATVYGTSFSAPHVAGAAALLLSASPGLTVDQLETALVTGSYDLPPAGPDNTTGSGRLDVLGAYNTLSDPVAAQINLAGPAEGSQLWKRDFPTFTWNSVLANGFELQFSFYPDFYIYRAFLPLPGTPSNSYTPDRRSWRKIKRLGRRGRIVYWRVKGTDMNGGTIYSDVQTFTILWRLPVLP